MITYLMQELARHPVDGFSAGLVDDQDIYEWEIMIIGMQACAFIS